MDLGSKKFWAESKIRHDGSTPSFAEAVSGSIIIEEAPIQGGSIPKQEIQRRCCGWVQSPTGGKYMVQPIPWKLFESTNFLVAVFFRVLEFKDAQVLEFKFNVWSLLVRDPKVLEFRDAPSLIQQKFSPHPVTPNGIIGSLLFHIYFELTTAEKQTSKWKKEHPYFLDMAPSL